MLPCPPRSAFVGQGASGWPQALRAANVDVVTDPVPGERVDLAVTGSAWVNSALEARAEMIVVEGRATHRALREAGFEVERYLPWPGPEAPEILLPLDQPLAVRYAIREWTVPTRRWKQARNAVLARLLDRGRFPPLRPIVTVGTRMPGAPFIVEAARRRFDLPGSLGWFLTLGEGDVLTRGVFQLFEPKASEPSWALKFARTEANAAPFDRDERGLGLVREVGGALARRAPQYLGRFEAEGLPASLETAATGRRMNLVLRAPGDRSAKLGAIEGVAAWLLEVARTTRRDPGSLAPELTRLAANVIPRWADLGADRGLLDGLDRIPAVFEHRDLGSWNVVARPGGFTAVDWESCARHGFPLWDLLYFLTDALAHLDGCSPLDERPAHAERLYRGELDTSAVLFSWLRRTVDALAIPPQSVGRLATVCWLHHGLSHIARGAAAARVAREGAGIPPYLGGIARAWLTDPALGSGWEAWRG